MSIKSVVPPAVDRVLRPKHFCDALGIHRSTLHRLIKTGELRSIKIGAGTAKAGPKASGILQSDFQAFLARRAGGSR